MMKHLEKIRTHPEYESLFQLVNQLDPAAPPRVELVHRCAQPIREIGKKLGIFSGSFNPLTVAHIKMIEEAQARFQLDELLLLLAKANVDKGIFGLPLAARLLTLKKYAESQPCQSSRLSIGACSHGRYIDKVTALRAVFPPETEFYFIVGYDTLIRIFDAKYYTAFHADLRTLFSACRFIVANRAEADINTIEGFMAQPEVRPYIPHVSCIVLPDVYADMSSTVVRRRLEQGKSIEHLVPSVISEFLGIFACDSARLHGSRD